MVIRCYDRGMDGISHAPWYLPIHRVVKENRRVTMATQGTTIDFIELLKAMADAGEPVAPEGKILFIFDMSGTYQKAIGFMFDNPNGGMYAPIS